MAVVSLLAIAILFLSNVLFFRAMHQEALAAGLTPDNPYFDFLAEQQSSLTRVYLGVSAVAFVVMVGLGILYSHRIAGPLHHLNNHMKQIAQGGDPAPVSFRQNDQFQELAESFNATTFVGAAGITNAAVASADGADAWIPFLAMMR